MTLFKKVFASHSSGECVVSPSQIYSGEHDDEVDMGNEIIAGSTSVVKDRSEGNPSHHEPQDNNLTIPEHTITTQDTCPGAEFEDDTLPSRTSEGPEALDEMTLADRAAQAQIAIQQTQKAQALARASRSADFVPREYTPETYPNDQVPNTDLGSTEAVEVDAGTARPVEIASPQRNVRRVRTRMLGFDQGVSSEPDPFDCQKKVEQAPTRVFPVGWIVLVAGPGRGNAFPIFNGVSTIGRGADQTIMLDFGDTSISREKHAAVAYDDEQNAFFLGHGGKSNIVRLNGRPVLSTEELFHGDDVRIGETTLRFVALCSEDFKWKMSKK